MQSVTSLPQGVSPLRIAMDMLAGDLSKGLGGPHVRAGQDQATTKYTGISQIVSNMKLKSNDAELQTICAAAIGHIAYKGNHRKHRRGSGQLRTIHYDYDEISDAQLLIQQSGAISLSGCNLVLLPLPRSHFCVLCSHSSSKQVYGKQSVCFEVYVGF